MTKSLQEIVHALVSSSQEIPDAAVCGLTLDSNQVKKGDMFIAIPGTQVDGHDYIHQAIDSGASAIISNGRDVGDLSVPQIKVANPRRAASIVAAEYYGHPTKHLTVIGITGTNGKTTSASLLTSILTQAGYKTAQLGTLGLIADGFDQQATLTTPDAISLQKTFSDLRNADFSHIVMEVSSHALDQYRVADVDFNVAVFTNLTPEHLDYHATLESYYQAKLRLFTMLPLESTAVINESDPFGPRMADKSNAPVISFSKGNGNSIHFTDLSNSISGIKGRVSAGQRTYSIKSDLVGAFNGENILAAVSVAHALGVEKSNIETGVQNCPPIPGRMESYFLASGATAIVDYAHTPDAYEKVLGTLKEMSGNNGRLYVVFGAGGDRDKTKRPEMARIAELFAHHCFITPDNPRTEDPNQISKDVSAGFEGIAHSTFMDREMGLRSALDQANAHDIVAVLGKGRDEYQEIMGKRIFYSDIKIIREYQ